MTCQSCGEAKATVHLTDIVEKQKHELHLCEACAQANNLILSGDSSQLNLQSLVDLITTKTSSSPKLAELICPNCGLNYALFRHEGRLGCPDDYDAFRDVLTPLLERIHRAVHHEGKTPLSQGRRAELTRIRQQLDDAIRTEHYEEAARLRDQLRAKDEHV